MKTLLSPYISKSKDGEQQTISNYKLLKNTLYHCLPQMKKPGFNNYSLKNLTIFHRNEKKVMELSFRDWNPVHKCTYTYHYFSINNKTFLFHVLPL